MLPWLPDEPAVQPFDHHNQVLLANAHPLDWKNPTPAPRYDLVVIGAGTAGLVVAAGAAGLNLGLKIALIEKGLMGGDCLTLGCVPSKTLLQSARVAATVRQAAAFGIYLPAVGTMAEIDFAAVMERVRRVRSEISHHDAAAEFRRQGIDIFFGQAAFSDGQTITVRGTLRGTAWEDRLRFKKAVIATGARAAVPDIPGLAEVGYLTHETVFSLTERPPRLAIIGGGPIGCELAQAFQRLGSQVTLLHRHPHLLNREEVEAAQVLEQRFEREGLHLQLGSRLSRVSQSPGGQVIEYHNQGLGLTLVVDKILVATGRVANLDGLNLAAAGVKTTPSGVCVNDYLQTTNPRIYAAGDVCLAEKFTHAADAAARIVIRNALFAPLGLGRSRLSQLVIPWATYTDPEVAHVGLYPTAAQAQGIVTESLYIPFAEVDRAITEGETEGFVKLLLRRGSDQILGATIVAPHAGDLISEMTLAMVTRQGLSALAQTIHPYPTLAEAIKKAADQYYRRSFLNAPMQWLLKLAAKLS